MPEIPAEANDQRIADIDRRHDRLLDELDRLNERIESALQGLTAE